MIKEGDFPGMDGTTPKSRRYRNITERMKSLLFLLREIPYATMKDIRRIFFPGNKSKAYSLEMMGVLLRNRLLNKHMIGDGVYVYYLSSEALRVVEFLLQEDPRFHSPTKSFYFSKPPRDARQVPPFFFFPARKIPYRLFTPHLMHQHPYRHTVGLFELYILFRNSFRLLYVIWLDQVEAKGTVLNVPFNPDLLLTNDPSTDIGRIYIEFENSTIQARNLLQKVNHISTMPADWFLVLCASQDIFLNFGRTIRRILLGEAKSHQKTLFFTPRAQAVLSRNLLIGRWTPSFLTGGEVMNIQSVEMFRFDHEVFDKAIWMNLHAQGVQVKDLNGDVPLKHLQTVPYAARKPGQRKWLLGDILEGYSDGFRTALQKVLWKPAEGRRNEGGKA
jgi:hypothetical protein